MDSSPRLPLQRRHDLDVVKQQLVVVVSAAATVFVLCPEWLQFYRNLAVIPLLAWLTAKAFDLVIMLNDKWDNAPAMVKYFVPIDFPQITPPFEKMRSLGNRQLLVARTKFRHLSLEVRAVVLTLVNWVLSRFGGSESKVESPGSEHKTTKPAPKPDEWVAILVTTPLINDDSTIDFGTNTIVEIGEVITWEHTQTTSVPAILPSSTFHVQMTVCLVPRSIWYSRKTVLEKFTTGLYWNHQPGQSVCQGEQWDEDRVRSISKVQVIGHVEKRNNIHKVNECFESLRQGWDDVNIYWSDIDFAIIFAFLLVGTYSVDICKKLFDQFSNLRVEKASRNKELNRTRLGAGAAVLTLLTGGLAAPITIPMMMGAEMTTSTHDRYLWGERMRMCKELLGKHEQLEGVIELEDTNAPKAIDPTPFFLPKTMESSWFVDDTW
ncbi:uncharacterized protein BKA55DRAFT_598301 [Fusarium redolens]|uniref:Uncharacterized protein n=1 Tax=Fusarium redolens TaxID=48865 RepID=A0A9P9G4D6_FUSRE|nr:uncharacterized protein BKA55DRAFT_598301 [Fusarium redolens]KAH7232323.1 hypothetical protein BKA55DRAFT_598301 [Fusarium redolens]